MLFPKKARWNRLQVRKDLAEKGTTKIYAEPWLFSG